MVLALAALAAVGVMSLESDAAVSRARAANPNLFIMLHETHDPSCQLALPMFKSASLSASKSELTLCVVKL